MIITKKDMYKLLKEITKNPIFLDDLDEKFDNKQFDKTYKIYLLLKEMKEKNLIGGISRFTSIGRPIYNNSSRIFLTPEAEEFINNYKKESLKMLASIFDWVLRIIGAYAIIKEPAKIILKILKPYLFK